MTSQSLLLWIVSGLLIQLAIFLGVGFWRNWLGFQALTAASATKNLAEQTRRSLDPNETDAVGWQGFRTFRVDRKVMEDAAQTTCSFYLRPEDGQPLGAFRPGQFLTFRLDISGTTGNSERLVRCYSLSDAPHPDCYRVSIKRLPLGRSSNYFHDQVQVGSILQVRAPSGHFYLDHGDDPVVLIAGGIGITPMLSMLNWCLTEQPGREVWLFYGIRNGREMIMKRYLDALAATKPSFHLQVCISHPTSDDEAEHAVQHHGRIDIELLRLRLPLRPCQFYVCGPTSMLESLVPALGEWGVPDDRINFEAFGPASIKRKQGMLTDAAKSLNGQTDSDIIVSLSKSGKQLPWQTTAGSLLEFAEANGIAVDSGCRAGSCGTCQTTIQGGEVAYLQAPEHDPEPGTCLLCVCAPKTSVTLEL